MAGMRRSDVVFRSLAVFASLVLLYYLGRPVWWMAQDWYLEWSEAQAIVTGGELAAVGGGEEIGVGGIGGSEATERFAEKEVERIDVVDPEGLPADVDKTEEIEKGRDALAGKESSEGEGDPGEKDKGDNQAGEEAGESSGAAGEGTSEGAGEGEEDRGGEGEGKEGEGEKEPEPAAAGGEIGEAATESREEGSGEEGEVKQEGTEGEKGPEEEQQQPVEGEGGIRQDASKKEAYAKGVRDIIHEGRPLLDVLRRPIWEKPPTDMAVPSKVEFSLRREMVEYRASNNVVVVTFANHAFMDFVTNWVRHLTDNGVFNILVGAMDTMILEGLFREGVPVFDMESNMSTEDVGWGTPIFHAMGREKVTLVNIFLSLNVELLICDTDVIFLRNPLPYMARYPQADVLASSDNLVRSVDDESLEQWDRAQAAYNIGILHFRPTVAAKKFARDWAELLAGDAKIWDQNGFNDIMRKKFGPDINDGSNVFWAHDGSLKLGILPVALFCSGHTFFVQRLYERVGIAPYAMHATFQFAGTDGKRHRFRESKEFIDPPEYYDPPGGIVAFVNRIPDHLLHAPATLENHFKLLNYQLKNLRQALAIALVLGRTLVMPDMWCLFDRIWYPHNGILDGVDMKPGFLCPLDHIIELQKLLPGHLDENEFGFTIPFREYSFLDNPRLPRSLLTSDALVELCDLGTPNCPMDSPPPIQPGMTVRVPKNSRENQLREFLAPYKDVKFLQFQSMEDSFGGWDNQEIGKKFEWRIRHITGIWCCVNAHPGHIWYDFFAADKPDWKPLPPKTWQDDHPAWD